MNQIKKKHITEFFDKLTEYNVYGYIVGGQAYKYYYNDINDSTIDYDIELYITSKQLNEFKTFFNIYNCINNLYNKCKKYINNLTPLQNFDYNKRYKKIYMPLKLIKRRTDYYNYNIICDIQIEDDIDTFIDIAVIYTPELEIIKQQITIDYYITKEIFDKKIIKYYNDLYKYKNKYLNKINKIKSRINYINIYNNSFSLK